MGQLNRFGFTELVQSVLAPAAVLSLVVMALFFFAWKIDFDRRDQALRSEIARNFIKNWGRCDLAVKIDKTTSCNVSAGGGHD